MSVHKSVIEAIKAAGTEGRVYVVFEEDVARTNYVDATSPAQAALQVIGEHNVRILTAREKSKAMIKDLCDSQDKSQKEET
jgi:hypothetical protein